MTSPVCKVFDKPIDSSQKIVDDEYQMNTQEGQKTDKIFFKIKSSNNKEYRITPVGSKDVAISRNTEAPKKDKPFVQFAAAPADAVCFRLCHPGRNPDHLVAFFFETPLKK
uniref:Major sperm protein n=1 Tax=Caenorhabditis japonica TaxID=281687 RepID=A0A8R1EV77_CAEJA